MQTKEEKRLGNRLMRSDPAVMVLADGQRVSGYIANMNMGGVLFVADTLVPVLQEGRLPVEIVINFQGKDSSFACAVVHHQDRCFGLRLHKGSLAEYVNAG